MKKIILICILFFNLIPSMEKGEIKILSVSSCSAQSWGEEEMCGGQMDYWDIVDMFPELDIDYTIDEGNLTGFDSDSGFGFYDAGDVDLVYEWDGDSWDMQGYYVEGEDDGDFFTDYDEPSDWTYTPPADPGYQDILFSPVLVATNNKVVKTDQESMVSCDNLVSYSSLGISNDYYSYSDNVLFSSMAVIFGAGTISSPITMAGVAADFIYTFKTNSSTSTIHSNPDLTDAVKRDSYFQQYLNDRTNVLNGDLTLFSGDINQVLVRTAPAFAFNRGMNNFNGLTILLDNIYSIKLEVTSFSRWSSMRRYYGVIHVTLDDDFGLDANDVTSHPSYDSFKAWYVLQHSRCYKPFTTRVEFDINFNGIY